MLQAIGEYFPAKVWKARSPFQTLVHTILSQNTNDRNSDAAMRKLRNGFKVTPRALAQARPRQIWPYIRSAGLYRSKASRIVEASRIIKNQYGGRLAPILSLPYAQAKETLMTLPGVGPKTADILLAFVAKNPVIPVDTHIARVTKRLGITPPNAQYERIRVDLENLIPPRRRIALHLSMIEFGRSICIARRPRCPICPVKKTCPSSSA